ncbi:MAG TPA: hypothetical protein VKC56_05595 [Gallionellaceae bacterium]|nr:hypothetical protein [Gallionellaceae bacterium]
MHFRANCIFLAAALLLSGTACAGEPGTKTPIPVISSAEANYLKLRDSACKSIKDKGVYTDYSPLDALQEPTEKIIGPINVDGFSGKGGLTILPDEDGETPCDKLDGLAYGSSDHKSLTVTTASLLINFSADPSHPPSSMEDLYAMSVIPNDPDVFAVLPVQKAVGQDFVYATLYEAAQDYGPFPPNMISVDVWIGNRRFTMSGEVKAPEIPECSKIWKNYDARADRAVGIYRDATSNGKVIHDANLENHLRAAPDRIRENGMAAFESCYRKFVPEPSILTPFLKQAQSMVNRIHPD